MCFESLDTGEWVRYLYHTQWGHAYFICWITESPYFKNPKVKKIKVPHYHFSPVFFFPPLICVTNTKKNFRRTYIGRAYKSAIPRGRLKCSAVVLLET
jgi:hypothetical protein